MQNICLNFCLIVAILLSFAAAALANPPGDDQPNVEWTGLGSLRLLVKVEPKKLVGRTTDELPAELAVDFESELRKLAAGRLPDIASTQVVRYDPQTGKPLPYDNYAYRLGPADRPFRWYDAAIPYQFPEFSDAVSRSKGKIERRPRVRGGYFYHVLGDWRSGRLAWTHTQAGNQPSWYAIYFDLLDKGAEPSHTPPRAWLGDGLTRCDKLGSSSMGADHCRVELDDWNDDGLVDLVVGESYGHIIWWPNLGTKQRPEFRYGKFVMADSEPLDAGLGAAPKVVDWDGDGVKDLLVGTHWNRLLFYRNTGTNRDRRLVYRGPVEIDGEPLQLPLKPLERGSTDIFRRDYYPIPETVDWDGDGDIDLLAGGYITGLIFFYENVGPLEDGTPRLRLQGPISADGRHLNVGHWCAAPCMADFDGDGDLDLISGNMPMHLQPEERAEHEKTFLQYFSNSGSRRSPQLHAKPFPGEGTFPRSRLATPRAYDWDDDGDLDLVVSARENFYLYENLGSSTEPRFDIHSQPLPAPWGPAAVAADQFRDWDGDGRLDRIRRYTVHLNSGQGNPFRWSKTVSVLPPGQNITHPSGIGDDWFWPYLDDFDGDGKIDVLFGDWSGHVWFHRNLSTPKKQIFDVAGFRLQLTDGQLIKVGPINKDSSKDFDALQGARTVLTVDDFNRDGLRDLIVGDTYGKVRYFRNVTEKGARRPRFAEPLEIGDLGIRGLVEATDWNQDGWPDVIASAANGKVRVILNQGASSKERFAEGFDPGLPPIIQPRVLVADLNADGDDDLFLPSTQGSCFVERSFLEHGYAEAELIAIERRK